MMGITPANAVVITIDNQDAGFIVTSGGTWGTYSGPASIKGDYATSNIGTSTDAARYDVFTGTGFVPGTYDVYAEWGANPVHASDALYTLNHANGTTQFPVSFAQNAAQGNLGSMATLGTSGSGLRFLGSFTLDGSSTMAVTHSAAQTNYLTPSAIMLRSAIAGRIIDQQSSAVMVSSNPDFPSLYSGAGAGPGQFGEAPSASYAVWITDTAAIGTWKPQYAGDGLYDLKISWQTWNTHGTQVTYLVDVDGNGVFNAGDFTIDIDQTKDSAGVSGSGYWSGFYDLGSYNLTAASQILQFAGNSNTGFMSAGPMLATLIPEPSGLVLLAMGFAGLGVARRRKR
jgi:hypothetical protein